MSDPIVVRGVLGWGNRKTGLEAYGPGGRWDNTDPGGGAHPRANPDGDLLGDALERAGAHEGATLLVIAVDRFGDTSVLDALAEIAADQTKENQSRFAAVIDDPTCEGDR